MKYLDLTFADPARNLACDETLLNWFEARQTEECLLRIWQPEKHFVVLGHSNKYTSEVDRSACGEADVPVLRRISGGGAVLQGPGCLNYSLIFNAQTAKLASVSETFYYVLQRHRRLVEDLKKTKVSIDGISDLTMGGCKFSGNAQYRKRIYVLVHGTFLLNFELPMIDRCLFMPARQPEYRANRSHTEFVANLRLDSTLLRAGLIQTWEADQKFTEIPQAAIESLAQERYRQTQWLKKF
jgi:lipoate-protein ligase A